MTDRESFEAWANQQQGIFAEISNDGGVTWLHVGGNPKEIAWAAWKAARTAMTKETDDDTLSGMGIKKQ